MSSRLETWEPLAITVKLPTGAGVQFPAREATFRAEAPATAVPYTIAMLVRMHPSSADYRAEFQQAAK